MTWFPAAVRRRMLEETHCSYCGEPCDELHIDHVVPKSRGGRSTVENVVPACCSCNSSKWNHLPEEWRDILQAKILVAEADLQRNRARVAAIDSFFSVGRR